MHLYSLSVSDSDRAKRSPRFAKRSAQNCQTFAAKRSSADRTFGSQKRFFNPLVHNPPRLPAMSAPAELAVRRNQPPSPSYAPSSAGALVAGSLWELRSEHGLQTKELIAGSDDEPQTSNQWCQL